MNDELKSPTCGDCARARGLQVRGDVHTIYEGECANCNRPSLSRPRATGASPGKSIHHLAWDFDR